MVLVRPMLDRVINLCQEGMDLCEGGRQADPDGLRDGAKLRLLSESLFADILKEVISYGATLPVRAHLEQAKNPSP